MAIPLKEKVTRRLFGLQTLEGRTLNDLGRRFCEIVAESADTYDIGR
jgi:hypothetical protein